MVEAGGGDDLGAGCGPWVWEGMEWRRAWEVNAEALLAEEAEQGLADEEVEGGCKGTALAGARVKTKEEGEAAH